MYNGRSVGHKALLRTIKELYAKVAVKQRSLHATEICLVHSLMISGRGSNFHLSQQLLLAKLYMSSCYI